MNKPEYKIGDWVLVAATVHFDYPDGRNRIAIRLAEGDPFIAQIVGAAYRQLGVYQGTRGPDFNADGEYDGDADPPYLKCTSTQVVYLVRRGMTNKTIEVLADDLAPLEQKGSLPWRWTRPYPWTDDNRKEMSQISKDFPRDSKGRFVKP